MPTQSSVLYSPVSESYMLRGESRYRSWANTPNFHTYEPWMLPVNRYDDVQVNGTAERLLDRRTSTAPPFTTSDTWFSWPKDPTTLGGLTNLIETALPGDVEMFNEALTKAFLKVSDAKSNIGVTLLEKVKTSDLILNKATQISSAYSKARKGDFAGAARILNLNPRTIHKSWLEMTYGWTPLVHDVYNAAEFLAQRVANDKPLRFTVSSTVTRNGVHNSLVQGGFNRRGFGAGNAYERVSYNANGQKVVRVKLWCDLLNPNLHEIQQLGMTNPALVLWEVVPFSFVFDWFIHVGDYIQALTATHGVHIHKAMASYSVVGKAESVESFDAYNGFYHNYASSSATRRVHNYRRYLRDPIVVNAASIAPVVDFTIPHWKRVVSALALMRSQAAR